MNWIILVVLLSLIVVILVGIGVKFWSSRLVRDMDGFSGILKKNRKKTIALEGENSRKKA